MTGTAATKPLSRRNDGPPLEEIVWAKRLVSDVIRLHGAAYTPLLERVLKEEENFRRKQALVDQAIRISTGAE